MLQLFLEILSYKLKKFNFWLSCLGVANPSNDSESIDKLMEWKTVVRCRLYFFAIMVLPKFFVFQHNFFEVFKGDDNWIDLAKFTKLKKLDG